MKEYLTTLIEEKGVEVYNEISIDGHIGITYEMLFDFIDSMPEHWEPIKSTLTKIDYMNGDVFHYLNHLANGMIESC